MKRKRGVPKIALDAEPAAVLLPEEQENPEPEPEDLAAVEWSAFAQDHFELVEQLPLSIHRSFSLMRELDDLAQNNTARIVPATKAYIALRDSFVPKPKGHRRAPSGLDLLAHVSAVIEPPAVNNPEPNLTNGVQETSQPTVNGQVNEQMDVDKPPETEDEVPTSAVDPMPVSPVANPLPNDTQPPTVEPSAPTDPELPNTDPPCANPSDTFPHDTRKLLTLIATLASDAVRASSEKLGIANAVYHSVGNHLTALDALIAQHKSTLPHPPTPTPPPPTSPTPTPSHHSSSPSTKPRARRRSLHEKQEDREAEVEEEQQEGTIPRLRLTRAPTTIRIRNKAGQRSVSMPKSTPGSSGIAKSGGTNKFPRNPPPTPRKSSNAGAGGVANRSSGNKNINGKGATDEVYCVCEEGSFGEMIACDGEGCEREWFHLPCVGLKVAPKANESWFCNDCAKAGIPAKKRRRR
ncbi:unnamed protein product [Rhizoctonia solani]|uniref:Chromatin modification-related protein n=1 Tax=Rhizoctonia solani TaxID=456999 RepID=A0A8H3DZU2_9AGAM|nr:unnamed protein product [Rhizoctonia solani]